MFPSLSCIFHIILQWKEPETCPGTDPRLSRSGADGKVLTFICWQETGEAANMSIAIMGLWEDHWEIWEDHWEIWYTFIHWDISWDPMGICPSLSWEDHWERWWGYSMWISWNFVGGFQLGKWGHPQQLDGFCERENPNLKWMMTGGCWGYPHFRTPPYSKGT